MRDIFLLTAIVILILFTLKKPQVGVLTWVWISIMNPHRETFGFIYSFPLLDSIVAVTILSCIFHWRNRAQAQFHPILKTLLIFYIWCTLTTIFAVDFSKSSIDWVNFTKTLLLVVVMLLFMNKKHWIIALCAVFVLSIGLTAIKGGIFTLMTGGGARVWGADGTAWGDNNGVSVAMLITAPLFLGFFTMFTNKWHKLAALGAAVSCVVSLLGTQSRGGWVGLLSVSFMAVMRTKKKFFALVAMLLVLVVGYVFMPQSWHDRMGTIATYDEDKSASTRLIQWEYAIDIALERPLFGNGFDAFYYKPYYFKHVAHKDTNRAVHSNYFQVLGEQGFIGLFIYVFLLWQLAKHAKKVTRQYMGQDGAAWATGFLGMLQFSVIGYAFNGLTVNMAYLDLIYYILAIAVLLISHLQANYKPNITKRFAYQPSGKSQPVKN